jgi:hypothetical protein
VLNISNITGENNPHIRAAQVIASEFDTWTKTVARTSARTQHGRFPAFLATGAALAACFLTNLTNLTNLPRRFSDHLFAMNDTEACWHGWQIAKAHGGLTRRYRDPKFDTHTGNAYGQGGAAPSWPYPSRAEAGYRDPHR